MNPLMTSPDEVEIAKIAKALSDNHITLMLSSWAGNGKYPTQIADLNAAELMHIDVLKDAGGSIQRWKCRPTDLGLAVRRYLENQGG